MNLKTKTLIIGASGQVGTSFYKIVGSKPHVIFAERTSTKDSPVVSCDLADENSIRAALDLVKPSLIINCAAYTAVDLAEKEQDSAYLINGKALEVLAKYADGVSANLIHYSTDYVFNGSGEKPWQESDLPNPLNIYGKSKLAGEIAIQKFCPKNGFIFRTQWVYANHGKNFLNTMLRLGAEREELSVVGDQIGAPTSSDMIARTTLKAVAKILDRKMQPGIYNLACRGETSWFGFAEEIFKTAKKSGEPIKVKQLKKINSADYPTPALRPHNSRLDLSKLESALQERMPTWSDELQSVLSSRKKV